MKSELVYLRHILDAIAQAEAYVDGLTEEAFYEDRRTRDAVAYQLQAVGEAAGRLPPEFRNANPHVPWPKMIGLRNRIAHDYLHLDYEIIWGVVHRELPALRMQLKNLL